MTIHYRIDISDVDQELERLENAPGFTAIAALEGVLAASFAATQAHTHVITGSLRNSGSLSSEMSEHSWEGTITYGGPSPGFPNDPVDYAIYEYARGGAHRFLDPASAMSDRYGSVVEDSLRGGK